MLRSGALNSEELHCNKFMNEISRTLPSIFSKLYCIFYLFYILVRSPSSYSDEIKFMSLLNNTLLGQIIQGQSSWDQIENS